ncbi:TPA: hypothetical protein DCQ44_01800 [Candidatus Taylorbacteria bacterium]|nr:hypothetical protein [Candidatus Taylorbacteria bacterium]
MDYVSKYTEFLKKHTDVKRPLKIVCDVSNGTTGIVLEKLGGIENLELILINEKADPEFPAHGPNPLIEGATDMLVRKVAEVKADFGVAFDADGDRAFFVDNKGQLLPSYVTAAIWFKYSTPPFVADELTYLSLTTSGLFTEKEVLPSRVGSLYVKEVLKDNDALLGVELSGHFYFKDFFGLDSGIFSMIYTANILGQQNKTLAQLNEELSVQSLTMKNITLNKATWEVLREAVKLGTATITKAIFEREGLTLITENGWINIRTSNTEPVVRIYVGAKTKELAEHDMALIVKIVENTDAK